MTIILGWYPETNTDDACSVKQLPGVDQPSSHTSPSQSHLSNPVKVEERTPPPVSAPEPDEVPKTEETYGWKHPAELQYYTPADWSQTKIILHLIANAFSIPPRPPARSNTPFFIVTGANGQTTRLPIGYRIPLMFIARFQWLSLELVLTASSRETEWEEYKFSILHVSRLCSTLLKAAQDVARVNQDGLSKGMDRKWRCPTFDRALTRYRLRWFVSNPSQVEEFFTTFSEEEFKRDAIKFDWRRWALKGYRGFTLTDEEITNGLTAQRFVTGLKRVNDDWFWDTPAARVEGGIDAWSLRTLALSSSTPGSELPSTYSQLAVSENPTPISLPLTPPTTATVSGSSQPPHRPPPEPISNLSGNLPSSSSNSNSVSKSGRPVRSSHANDLPSESASAAVSPQKPNPRKRPGSPLDKEVRVISKRQQTLSKKSDSAAIEGKQSKDTPNEKKTGAHERRSSKTKVTNTGLGNLGGSNDMDIDQTTAASRSSGGTQLQQQPPNLNGTDIPAGQNTPPAAPPAPGPSSTPQQRPKFPQTTSIPSAGPSKPSSSSASSSSTSTRPALSSDDLTSPESIIHIIDTLFVSFADSLSRFSDEIRQAKVENVAETLANIKNAFMHSQPSEKFKDMIRDVVREEVRKAMQEEPVVSRLMNEIVDATQREMRDGVRVLVATLRTEVVENLNEVGARVERLVDQDDSLARQLAEIQQNAGRQSRDGNSVGPRHRRTSMRSEAKAMESDRLFSRFAHPLQHLLGEPEEMRNTSGDDGKGFDTGSTVMFDVDPEPDDDESITD
ncbi:hypothetical protein F5878DRAFT_708650 [Lentinula raphanica]|uniref:Uncharacterized protein n=1 Tax=Lentinula raphanica TaxID=153919 RepID=A0AA38PDC7_9AGAR|nr:hypothetical protein F5880DRAFT_1616188 [Lentinula raphanica]KAJ3840641.1 hypothetical protein F5878DRAFT_708650 [Lentinula raphanica]